MKKLLIGLLALGSISAFSSDLKTFENPSIEMKDHGVELSYSYRARSNGDELCKHLTKNDNSQIESRVVGRVFITPRNGVSSVTIKSSGDMKIHRGHNVSIGTRVIRSITCSL
jgi:hypothetical protein